MTAIVDSVFDAVVIGGGPAGLSAATCLARLRRSVLIVDEGRSRAARIPRTHNYPGFAEGVEGGTLVAAMQHQALRHGVNFAIGRVSEIERRGAGFGVVWPGGQATARTVLLASGVSDIEPGLPHLAEGLRRGLLRYCPWCDAYEAIDKAVGVVTDSAKGVSEALFLRDFTDRLTLFVTRADADLGDDERARLAAAGIALVEAPTTAVRLEGSRVVVSHGSGETVLDTLYCALGVHVHSELARRLGARHDNEGFLYVDPHHRTSVDGLYAAGDVVRGLNQISVAAGGGAIAASAMHLALRELDERASAPAPAPDLVSQH
jgi:thioredoxin reductase (NADPH)